ncbi:unnamed protein product [Closterium sp. Naga37s-1]|nr:unnamed protein product [Closterium sp. Naga37s-1]
MCPSDFAKQLQATALEAPSTTSGGNSGGGSTSTAELQPLRRSRQRDIRDLVDVAGREWLDHLWAAAVADNDLVFRVSKSMAMQSFVDAAIAFGRPYTLPSPSRVGSALLEKLVAETEDLIKPMKDNWATNGCTLSVDRWTCLKSRGMVCMIAHNHTTPVIVGCIDSKITKKTGEYLSSLIQRAICKSGDRHVVQVVMDNAANDKKAAALLHDGFPHVFFTNCAAHVLDLMLHDMGKIAAVKRVLNQVHRIVMIMKGSASAVALFREVFSELELVQPGASHFGTQVNMITRFLKVKQSLKEMVISEEWQEVAVARSDEGKAIRKLLLEDAFWGSITVILGLMNPVNRSGQTHGAAGR